MAKSVHRNPSFIAVVSVLLLALSGASVEAKAFFVLGDSLVDNGNNNYLVDIIRIFQQLNLFEQYQQRVNTLVGEEAGKKLVNESLVLMTLGGNDFVNNYYLVSYSVRSRQYDIKDYVSFVISEYKKVLMRLYKLGARRVIVTGTGPLGCVPAELALHSRNGECAVELQKAAGLFNPRLVQMLDQLNDDIGSKVFIAANTNKMHMDFISNPEQYGIRFLNSNM